MVKKIYVIYERRKVKPTNDISRVQGQLVLYWQRVPVIPEFVTTQRSITVRVKKKIVVVTTECENGEKKKNRKRGENSEHKTLGFITIVEGCRDKVRLVGG